MPTQKTNIPIQNKVIIMALFWMLSAIILYRLFTIDYSNGLTDIIFTALFHIPLFIVVMGNIIAIDALFLKKKYIFYILVAILLIPLGVGLFHVVFGTLAKLLAPHYYLSLYYSSFELIQYIAVYLIVSFLTVIALNWYHLKNRQISLEKENNIANIRLLKAQLNPHFLFNSLNNIYSLSGRNSQAGEYILKLSDSMRYMTYETDEKYVPLENELNYIRNYVDLEKLRISPNENIRLQISGDASPHLIAPLIFLPFVENCFKHCNRSAPIIDVQITINENHVHLKTKNNLDIEPVEEKIGGVGINNIQKRLELIYSDQYQLNKSMTKGFYTVDLQLNLNINED